MKRKRTPNYKFLENHAWYLPGVGGMFGLLLWLLVGALIGNVLTLIFQAALGPQAALEYGILISYPVMFIPAMMYASVQSRKNRFNEGGVKLDSNHFGRRGGLLLFGERLNLYQWIGVIIAVISFYMLSVSGKKEGISFTHNKWVFCVIMATLLGAVSALFDKYLLGRFNNMFVQAWSNFYQLALMTAILFTLWWPTRKHTTPFQWKWPIIFIAVFLTLADYAYFVSLASSASMVSIVSMIRRSSVIVSFLCGALLFHEKNLKSKVIDLLLVLLGLFFLLIGSLQ